MSINSAKLNTYPWWNRPLIGDRTLLDYLFSSKNLPQIPLEYVQWHDRAYKEIGNLALTLKVLLHDQFTTQAFFNYAQIKTYLSKNKSVKEHYLSQGNYFFQTIFTHLDILIKLSQIEESFENDIIKDFQESYFDLIDQQELKLIFQARLKKTYQLYLQELDQEKEIYLFKKYYSYLLQLSEFNDILYFFSLLKSRGLDNWQLFRSLEINFLSQQDQPFNKLDYFRSLSESEKQLFIDMTQFIFQIQPTGNNQLVAIANILEYTALSYQYQRSYTQFLMFLNSLANWETQYRTLTSFRGQFSPEQYTIPHSFKKQIKGFEIYKIYRQYLDLNQTVDKTA